MFGFATIRKNGFPDEWLERDRWRSLTREFPELRRKELLRVGSQQLQVPDRAEYLEDGEAVGAFTEEI